MKIFLNDLFNNCDLTFISIFIIFFLFFYFYVKFWRSLNLYNHYSINYSSIQKSHDGVVPRTGGLFLLVYLLCQSYFSQFIYNFTGFVTIFLCLIPLLVVTFIEDLFHNIHYIYRLFFSFLSIFLLMFLYIDNFPNIHGIPWISFLFENHAFSYLFFSLCLLLFINGCNFLDGMNGLLVFNMIGFCISFLYLSFLLNDKEMASQIILYFSSLILFIFFNFPVGRIFLGDLGAYFFAILFGIWAIEFFAKHETLSSWNIILIFFYPIFEVIFSFIRKTFIGYSPFKPDDCHLHMLIYKTYLIKLNKKNSNNLTTISLLFFIVAPVFLFPLVRDNHLHLFFSILFLIFSYLLLFFYFYKLVIYHDTKY